MIPESWAAFRARQIWIAISTARCQGIRFLAPHHPQQRLALDVLHRVVVVLAVDAAVEQLDDVRVLELPHRVDFAVESLDEPAFPGERGGEHFIRPFPRRLAPGSTCTLQIDVSHPAGADPFDNPVRTDPLGSHVDRYGGKERVESRSRESDTCVICSV